MEVRDRAYRRAQKARRRSRVSARLISVWGMDPLSERFQTNINFFASTRTPKSDDKKFWGLNKLRASQRAALLEREGTEEYWEWG